MPLALAMQAYQTPIATPGQPTPPGTKTYSVDQRARRGGEQACSWMWRTVMG